MTGFSPSGGRIKILINNNLNYAAKNYINNANCHQKSKLILQNNSYYQAKTNLTYLTISKDIMLSKGVNMAFGTIKISEGELKLKKTTTLKPRL